MAEIASTTFSQTDASNTGPLPGLTGATNPNQIDNSIQAMMGAIKREHDWRNLFLTSGGSSNAYTLTYSVAPAAYYTGQTFSFTANFGCTGSATLNVNSLGAKTIKKDVAGTMTALSSGDIASGAKVVVSYDGTDFIWTNWQGAASVPSGALTSSGYTMSTARLIGRTTASTGAPEEISVGSSLSLSAGSLSVTAASDTATGAVELATSAETVTGTDTTRATTPAGVAAAIAANPGGMQFIGHVSAASTSTQAITGIGSYSSFLFLVAANSTSTSSNDIRVALSSNNGSSYSTTHVIANAFATALKTMNGSVTVSNTNNSGANKVVQPRITTMIDMDATGGADSYSTSSTETTVTGIINAIRFDASHSNVAYSVTVFGIP